MPGMWKTGGLTPAARLSVCNYGVNSRPGARDPGNACAGPDAVGRGCAQACQPSQGADLMVGRAGLIAEALGSSNQPPAVIEPTAGKGG